MTPIDVYRCTQQSLESYLLKRQQYTTPHPLRWLQPKTQITTKEQKLQNQGEQS